ncbi:PREDICTED: receptor-like kinase TMK4 [Camelina sativa]|uniref:Receptor-like kinase TMK4 n=1 Tax=Camelina sativa TaxID=90675 RepID=A0ABM0WB42_CAMSA|nr:PREDICTED: receptor-like kinase TMK4 [Camelina sativa]
MSQGNLGHHLFDPAKHGYFPLTWKQRVRIALDVAQGVEYFHRFALESSIHRDIKSSNILLGDDMTAKVSDFGLVKVVAADGNHSAVQKTEGTFGYIAPEYAIDGVLTTKVDVYAFGVVLMEMITGKEALKEISGEETFQLVPWFRSILVKGKIRTALDLTLDCDYDEVIIRIIQQVAKLASYCTSRKPKRRPDMGHAVNVLKQLVEKWKSPCEEEGEEEESLGKDMDMNLVQCLQKWQDEGASSSAMFSEPLPDEKQTIFREPLLNPRAKKDKYSEEEEEERMMRLLTITPKDDPEQLRRMIRYKIRNRSKLINDI